MNGSEALSGLSTPVIVGISALVLVQLTLQVIALVQLVRTPADRVTIGGRKWAWVLIIAFGEIAGPIIWFAAGRKPAPADDVRAQTPAADRATAAADALYGAPGESKQS